MSEGDSDSTNLTFTVTLSAASGQQVTVDYADAGTGTATSGTDYTTISGGALTFAAGTTSQTFDVSVTGDTLDEANETVVATLSNAANATISTATGTGTITDNDPEPSLSIDSPSVSEGDSDSTNLTFTVTLSAASGQQVTVDYADAGTGTATSGTDYTAITGGALTFAAGTTSQTFDVSVTGDTLDEANETVVVTLSNAANATIGTASGTGTITDNDDAPTLSIDSPSVTEGDSDSTNLTFTVTLSAASGQQVTVDWTEGTGGTATSGTDYTTISGGALTFAAGTTSQDITVSVTGDTLDEADETVVVTLSNAANATISTATGTGTITDNDEAPSLSINSPSVSEGDSGSTNLTFTVKLSAASGKQVTVDWAEGTGGTATSGTDYTAITGGALTFAAGTTSQDITVSVTGDTLDEANETVIATLSGATNATISTASGTGTITDDDATPTLSIDSPSMTEGDSGSTNLTFTVTLSAASDQQVTVTYADAGTGTATSGTDYTAITGGTLTFAAGTTNQDITVSVTGDTTDEADETVAVTLSNAANAAIATATGTGTITDNDAAPTLSINSPSVTEGDSGATNLTFTVTLSAASGQQVTVDWAEGTGGTATSGTDYTAITGGALTFAAGTTSQTLDVSVTGDTTDEADETVVVTLSNAANATISTATGTGTITDNDGAPTVTLSVADDSISENGGSTTVSAALSHASSEATTITISPLANAYAVGSDATIAIAAGETANPSDTATINAVDNDIGEADRSVIVTGSASNARGIGQVTGASLTLEDDDGAGPSEPQDSVPTVSIRSTSATEGNSGSSTMRFVVRLSAASSQQVTVDWAEGTGGTATSGTDYTALTGGTLTFAAGMTWRPIDVLVTGDTLDEAEETVVVTLSNAVNATIGTATGTGRIVNDDQGRFSIDSPRVAEGDSGSTNLTFTVTLSNASGRQVTVDWAEVTGGTATSGTDYTAITGGTLTFAPGTTSQTIDVSVIGDTTEEPNETVRVRLSNAVNATISRSTGTGTIVNDEGVTISIDSPSVTEGDSDSTILTYTVTLSAASDKEVSVEVYISDEDSTATRFTDYTRPGGRTLNFAPGTTSQTTTIYVLGDVLAEANETVGMLLWRGRNATVSTALGTGTIIDDDAAPTSITLTVNDDGVGEGDGATAITVTATVDGAARFGAAKTVTVSVAGSGTAGAVDFAAVSNFNISIAAGAASGTGSFTLTPTNDSDDETDETITVSGTSTGLTVNPDTISLTDNDGAPTSITLTVDDNSVDEGDGGTTITVTARLNGTGRFSSAKTVQVNVSGSGTATAVDFAAVSSFNITIPARAASKTGSFTLTPTDDVVDETNETVTVSGTSSGLTVNSATITLTDDDAAPTLVILTTDTTSVGEGDGATTITVTLTVDGTTRFAEAQTVRVSVGAGTTTEAVDFAEVTPFDLSIAAGAASGARTFTLTPTDDALDENDNSVNVGLIDPNLGVNVLIRSRIRLTDNDAAPTMSIDSPRVTEGDSGSKNLTFTVTLSAASGRTLYAYDADAGTGTATSGTDYTAITGGSLYFAPGTTSQTFDVSVTGDTDEEPNETVVVTLTLRNANGAMISTATGTGTIVNDDGVTVSIDSPSVMEGDSGSATLTFTATLSKASTQQVTVNYADAGTGTATSGTDYTAITGGTLTFAVGTTSQTFDVSVTGDTTEEPNETVVVTLSGATNATISTATGTGTIVNDDGVTVSINSPDVIEGDSGSTNLTFTVTLNKASTQQVTVDYADAGSGTATSGTDYTAITGGTLTFAAGTTSQTFNVSVTGDGDVESNETVVVTLSNAANATIATATGTGTITDDDATPTLSIDSPSVTEGDSGSKNLTFTVTLSAASSQRVTVDYADAGTGTATSGTDYTAITGGTLTFAVGTTSQTFDVSVTGDRGVESNETVVVTLSNAANATIATATGTGTIIDDDATPLVSINSPRVAEGDSGSTNLTFTVTLSAPSGRQVTVDWAEVTGGTATSGTDYTAITGGTLTFAPGTTSQTIDVSVIGDTTEEPNETVRVRLSNAVNATISRSTGTGTIANDEGVTISINSPSVSEGDSDSTILTYTVTLSAASDKEVSVEVYISDEDSTATWNTDYVWNMDYVMSSSFRRTLIFAPGTTSQTTTIYVLGDVLAEANETVGMRLSRGRNATVSTALGTGTIIDDDAAPTSLTLTVNDDGVGEGDGATAITVTATVDGATRFGAAKTVSVSVAGSGTAGAVDFAAVTDFNITIAAGAASGTGAFTLTPTDDAVDETDETVTVSGTSTGLTVNPDTISLTDNDGASTSITLTVDDNSVDEGDGGTTITVTATLNGTGRFSSAKTVQVNVSGSGTATAVDFAAVTAFDISITAGAASGTGTFTLTPTDDVVDETNETVTVSGTSSGLTVNSATITLTDDDAAPASITLTVDDNSVGEGDGATTITVTLTVDGTTRFAEVQTMLVRVEGSRRTTDVGYAAVLPFYISIAAGAASGAGTFTLTLTDDALDKNDHRVRVIVTPPSSLEVNSNNAKITLTDNDAPPTASIDSPRVTEGDSGSKNLTFTVTLSAASGQGVGMEYEDAGTGTATAGTDYTAISRQWLVFPVGTTSQTLDVSVTGDTTEEANETVVVTLINAQRVTLATATGTGTIVNDDGVTVSIDSPSVTEGDSGSTNLTFTATLNKASTQQVTVDYADAGTGTATSGTDYTAITGGTLTFAAGTTSQTFDVSVTGDTLDESNETVVVTLSDATNATISTATGTGTITDDDDAPMLSIDSPSVTEGDSGSTNLTFTATLSAASGKQVTVDWAEGTGGTATSVTDYTAITGGTLTFPVGTTNQTFNVSVTGDTDEEPNETVVATLSNATNATIATATGTGTIVNDDGVTVSIDSPSVTEGDSGSTNLRFTATLSKSSADQVTVDYADAGTGTATSGTDYRAITGGTLTFAAGTTSQTFDVSVTGDTTEESNETVVVTLSDATNATIATASGTGTITDDDRPTLSIDSPSVTEGDSGTATLTFTVTLNKASADQVTVDYADAGTGTATSGTDYTAITGGTLTFAAGITSQTFSVSVTGDGDVESNETVVVTLSNAANATIATATGTGTITDDDATPALSIDSPSVTEGDSGSTNLTFTVTLSAASGRQVTVAYADAGTGTATSGTDYTAITGGTLTFAAGTTSQTFDVSVTGDTLDEANETVVVTLSGATNATISTASGTGTITDNDDAPTLSINSPSVTEGDSGSTNLTFTVTLSAASGQQVTVAYADAGTGTATSGTDYTAVTGGTLTFAVGTTSQTFDVAVTGDTLDEANETVVVTLSSPTNATIATASGTGTITDNDGAPTLSIDSPSVTEGDSGSTNLRFTVTLSAASGQQVTVQYADAGTGTATSGTDYTTITGGALTFAVGTTSQTFDVSVTGDTLDEANETVVVTLSSPTNATIATASGTGTITDNDATPTLSIDSPSVTEGDSGSTNLGFTVTLSAASGQQVTVQYADAGTGTATSGTDYTAITGGTLTFEAGTTSQTFNVSVTGDTLDESNETVVVSLSSPTNATVSNTAGTGTGTITDNDATPTLSIDSPSVTEGDSGSTNLEFTVTLSAASGRQVTVQYADAGTGTATSGTDYTAITGGALTFAVGTTSQTFDVSVTGDVLDEANETVVVSLSSPTNATISSTAGTGTGTITDNDATPSLSINSPSVTEGDSGSATLTFTVTLSAASGRQVTVDYADAGTGTATSGTDYTAITGGALTFAAGTTSQTFDVSVTGDVLDESNETVVVTLSNAANAMIATATGTGTITDNDTTPTLSIDSPSVTEGDSGSTNLRFTVTLSAASGQQVTVAYADAGTGTATSGTDYTAITGGTLTFAVGTTSQTFDVSVTGDTLDESNETVVVTLSNAGNATIATATGTGTITDNDATPTLSIDSPSVTEGDSGSTNLRFTVTLSAASGQQVTVAYADAGTGTATSGTDYTAVTGGTLTFAVGTTSQTFDVSVTGDTLDEADETVVVTLSGATNATIPTASGTGTITDNDGAPTLSIDSPSVTEGDSGSTNLRFTVTLSAASGRQVTVAYADAGTGTATSGTDYTAITGGTLTFTAGTTSQTFDVAVTGDTLDESNETVVVTLSNVANATISTASGTGTITDNDATPTLSIDSPSVTEGNSGSTNLGFTVTLSAASGQQVTVAYADAGTGTATSGTDYTAVTGGTLTFATGTTSQTFNVSVTGDTADESNETVVVTLSSPTNATIGTASGTGTITDDDGAPTLSINSPSVTEGNSGSTNLRFTVTLSAASGQQVTVDYADAGTGTATSGTDYTAITGGTLTFTAGTTSQTFDVSVTGDTLDEANETVIATLSGATNATISTASGTGTITDDDDAPTLSINSPSVTEGDSGSTNLRFTVTLSAASGQQVTVAYADAGTGTATSGTDYTAITGGTLTFAVGTTSQTFDVSVTGDVLAESNETVVVTLSGAANATISTASGTGTITDNDAAPTSITLTVDDNSVGEGDGATTITVTATVDGTTRFAAATTVTVSVGGSGTATAVDFATVSDFNIEIAAGAESKTGTFTLTPTDDALDEADETVTVSGASGSLTVNSATISLTDNDSAPTLSIDSPSVTEGDSGSKNLRFTVTLSAASGQQVTVAYADAGTGTATSGTDYTAITSGALTFAVGTTSQTFDVSVTGDTTDETDETVIATLSGATNATISTASGTGTIMDDDGAPSLSINSPSVTEGDSGSKNLRFTVTLSPASGQQVTVAYADAGTGTATSGTDYTAVTGGTLTFAAGTTSQTFDVSVTGDVLDEADETVIATLSGVTNATIATASGTGTITDDDDAPTLSIDSPSVTEGDSGSTNLRFTVTLSAASGRQVTVAYADAGTGTATSGTDYTAITGGTLTFAVGTTSQTFDVSVTGDTLDEANETVIATLSGAMNATIATASGTGTITDEDDAPTLSINSPSVTEGNSGSTNLTFTVTLSAASGQQVTVAYADAGTGTATSGTDYTAITGGTLTFAAATTSQTFDVSVTGDTLDEANETVVVTLSSPTNATIATATGTGTITDNDATPTLSINSPSVTEGDSGSTTLRFTVTLSAASGRQVTVDYADAGTGTATSGTDYTAVTGGALTFAVGTTSQTFDVSVTGDVLDEANETVVVTLSNAANATISTASGTGTITDNDGAPTLSIDSPSVTEGDSGSTNLRFTVTLSAASGQQVTVAYANAGTGTATSGTDYTAVTAGTLTFAVGTTSQTFNVAVLGDTLDEANETIVVTLSGATNATIATATGTGTITDNDDAPTLSINSPSVTEGDSGSTNLRFTVTLSAASGQQVTVAYADAGTGTATSGTDYTAVTGGTLTFAVGTTSQTFDVSVTGDTLDEANETIVVTLSGATNATISTASGTGTITDNDATPTLSINSPSVTEGDSGSTNLTFTVTLSAASGQQVTVAYADAGTGTATSGTDYTAITGGTLTFTAGTISQTFNVSVTGDTLDEANETVVVTLSSPTNATISTATGTGTITDNDATPTLSINSPSVTEGDSGSTNLTFTVTLSAASGQQVTVDWAEGTGGTATSGTDYTAITGGALTFAAGTTSQTFDVSVTGDTLDEPNETVVVTLSNAANATISTATGTGTITDDDGASTLSINSPSVTEGDSGSKNLTFTVTLSPASGQQVTVAYADAGTGTATSGTDYTAIAGGTLTFTAGATSQTFNVSVLGDTLDEVDETVVVTLSNPTNATISTATGTGAITDNDATPTLSINSPSVTEGDSGSTNLTFTVTLSASSGQQVTVAYADAGTGTATSGTDYTAITGGTLTFAVGTTSQTFDVSVTGDTLDESNETVVVSLSSPTNATISTGTGTGTITDNDGAPTLSINSPSVTEGDSGSTNLTFTVTLSAASGQQVTVQYADAGTGTATSGTDYTAIAGSTLTFAVGTTSQTFNVSVTGDTTDEVDETVVVTLSSPTNATISTGTGTGTITDNDGAPTLSINSPGVTEGDSGSTNLTFTVTLSAASGRQVTVAYADAGTGTATSGTDYTAITGGALTFAVGTISQTFNVSVTGDTLDESNETVVVSLSSPTNATISTATGTGTITDDDGASALSINSPRVTEGNSGSTNLTFTVTLSPVSTQQVTVAYADAGSGTATSGTDYAAIPGGTLTFPAGTALQEITVSVTGDTTVEPDETVVVSLSNPANALIGTGTGTGTIVNDDVSDPPPVDDAPSLSIDSPSVAEGDNEMVSLTFTVTLSPASSAQVTVDYVVTGTAASGTDYSAITGGTLTFPPGTTSQTITVSVMGDVLNEGDETIVVTLSNVRNAAIDTATGTGTITDDDSGPKLSIDSPSVAEGDSGSTTLTFTVTLSEALTEQVTVNYADAGTGTATSGTDYTAIPGGALTFAAGTTSQTFNVSVTGDVLDEADETVVVTLSNAVNAAIGAATGTGTITDDDAPPSLSIDSPSVPEGDDGLVTLTWTVTLSAASGRAVTVDYADAGTGTATSGTDYAALTAGTLTFAAGTTIQEITVSVTGDITEEPDETVVVTLSNAGNATIGTATGTGAITDDDALPTLSIDSPSVSEGDGGSRDLTFTVTLSAASTRQVTVDYADAGTGTATPGTDYAAITAGALTFPAGTTSQTFNVSVTGDVLDEADETVVVTLSNAGNATIGTGTGTGTITDDDEPPALSIDSPSVSEGDDGSVMTWTVALSAASGRTVTVDYADAGTGTATPGTDYAALAAGTLTFAAGTTSRTFDVLVTGDDDTEPDETVVVTLSNAGNATIGTATGTGTIVNDDIDLKPSFGSATIPDQSWIQNWVVPALTLPAATGGDGALTYALTPELPSGLSFDRTTRELSGTPTRALVATEYSLTATDEDGDTATLSFDIEVAGPIALSIEGAQAVEGEPVEFGITLSRPVPAAGVMLVVWRVTDGTALAHSDYAPPEGRRGEFTIAAGQDAAAVIVQTTNDDLVEDEETFTVTLVSASHAELGDAEATGRIVDDDLASLRGEALQWSLAAFGRTVATEAVDAIGQRFRPGGTPRATRATRAGLPDASPRDGTDTTGAGRGATGAGNGTTGAGNGAAGAGSGATGAGSGTAGAGSGATGAGNGATGAGNGTVGAGNAATGAGSGATGAGSGATGADWTTRAGETDALSRAGSGAGWMTGAGSGATGAGSGAAGAGNAATGAGNGATGADWTTRAGETDALSRAGSGAGWMTGAWRNFFLDSPAGASSPGGFSGPERSPRGEFLSQVAFETSLGATDDDDGGKGRQWTLWGRGSRSQFSGQSGTRITLDGKVNTGYLGADVRLAEGGPLLGVALSHSIGELDYRMAGAGLGEGQVDVDLSSVLPYGHWALNERVSFWGLLGIGWGKASLTDEFGRVTTDTEMQMAALGSRGELVTWRGVALALKGDAFVVNMEGSEWARGDAVMLPEVDADANRLRLMVEGRREWQPSAQQQLGLSLEFGGRWDGGDADTGMGTELGGGLEYRHAAWGLGIETRGRYLLGHTERAFEEWGASVALALDPGEEGIGPSLTLVPAWGEASSGVENMWRNERLLGTSLGDQETLAERGGWRPNRLRMELGYGFETRGPGLLKLYSALEEDGPGRRNWRLGSQVTGGWFTWSLELDRRENWGRSPEHGVFLRFGNGSGNTSPVASPFSN